jgi:hypothetical protein
MCIYVRVISELRLEQACSNGTNFCEHCPVVFSVQLYVVFGVSTFREHHFIALHKELKPLHPVQRQFLKTDSKRIVIW